MAFLGHPVISEFRRWRFTLRAANCLKRQVCWQDESAISTGHGRFRRQPIRLARRLGPGAAESAGRLIQVDTPDSRRHDSMMDSRTALDQLLTSGVVAILRSTDASRLIDAAEALVAGGVTVMEITFTVPRAHEVLERMAERLADKVVLGAGTVLDAATARIAILAGAEFIVSPVVSHEVIATCRRYSKLSLPGALTPTEIFTAWEAGADIVKVFPSEVTGPAYLKAVRAPLPQVRLMPTGGVNLETAADFLRAGACALGLGGSLVEPGALASGDMGRIESLARQYLEIVRRTRAELAAARSAK
jgi:2-dehydro-3-deoxyphosphogluconate aldolase / (4S)-4-hydroxy-2-oxoglutarate aldolase